jgi:hypothetical protein
VHYDRLIAALNKFWRPVTDNDFWFKMDVVATNNAIAVAGFPREVEEWIWEREKEVFKFVERKKR